MAMGDTLHVKHEGREYEIPEAWLVGFTSRREVRQLAAENGVTTTEYAIAWWHMQQLLEEGVDPRTVAINAA